jgi:enoyl-CoA hydratase/carnithine racemase
VAGSIAEIVLNRPPVNALTLDMIKLIVSGLREAASDPAVRAVVVSSEIPRRFCAGLDLALLPDQPSDHVSDILEQLYIELFDAQHKLGKPSIAAVGGASRGGGMTVAISCDVILADEDATFGYPEIDVGLIPGIHFVHLPRIIGRHRAFELMFSGRPFSAVEARELGIVSRIVSNDRLLDEAHALARTFAAKPSGTMELGRAAFMRANDLDYRRSIEGVVDSFRAIVASDDFRDGLRAFKSGKGPGSSRKRDT